MPIENSELNQSNRKRSDIMRKVIFMTLFFICAATTVVAQQKFGSDTIKTVKGDLIITFVGHGTLMMFWGGKIIHVDPFSAMADYTKLPKADMILITHEHFDHLDLKAVNNIKTAQTKIIGTSEVAKQIPGIIIMKNGGKQTVNGLQIEAVPAYNIVHMREPGNPFHPKGVGNGYILTFGDKRIYLAGDTENIPEMKNLKSVDIAFLPMNLPYTMSPEMVADAVKAFRPKILYPYHYGNTDTSALLGLLKGESEIEVRIRKMQ